MKRTIINFVMVLAFLFLAYPAAGQKVKVNLDQTVDLSRFKTYTWVKGMAAKNPIVNQMITDAIDAQLAAKGFKKVDADGDVQILFFAAMDLSLYIPEVGWSNVSNPQGSIASIGAPTNIPQGTLVVDMMDRKTQRFFWRASARETLASGRSGNDAKDAQRVQKLVTKAVAKMFDKYPATN
jgi:hypothetical protein